MTESQTQEAGAPKADDGNQPSSCQAPITRLRSFWLMFVVEFQNTFSDNTLKFVVTFFIMGMGLPKKEIDSLVPLVGAVFALPFVLFSMAGGFFADHFSKRNVAVTLKWAELGIMSVASLGFWLQNVPLMLGAIFQMSTHSAIFGPTKYGMLPELLPEKKLSWGNGIFGLGTFASTIGGQIFAGRLSDLFGKGQIYSGGVLIMLALIGLTLCLGVTRQFGHQMRRNEVAELAENGELTGRWLVDWIFHALPCGKAQTRKPTFFYPSTFNPVGQQ